MKSLLTPVPATPARLLLAGAAAAVLLVAVLPPLLAPEHRLLVMDLLAPLCHQLPDRSFALDGVPLGLCHRCTAVFMGLAVALSLPLAAGRGLPAVLVLGVALGPPAADWGLEAIGLWANTAGSRVATGLWAGAVLGLLIGASMRPGTPAAIDRASRTAVAHPAGAGGPPDGEGTIDRRPEARP